MRWRHFDAGGDSGGGPRDLGGPDPGAATIALAPQASTVRDVTWLGAGGSGAPPLLAACGGGDFGVSVFDVAALHAAWPGSGGGYGAPAIIRGPMPLLRLRGHSATVHALSPWGADGRVLLSASADGTLRLWDVRAGPSAVTVLGLGGASGAAMRFEAPGRLLSRSPAAGAGVVELLSLAVRPAIGGAGGPPREAVVGSADGCVAVVDVAAGRMVAADRVHGSRDVRSIAVLGPLVLSAGFDGSVAVSHCASSSRASAAPTLGSGGAGVHTLAVRMDHRDKALCAKWHPADVSAYARFGFVREAVAATSATDRSVLIWRVNIHE